MKKVPLFLLLLLIASAGFGQEEGGGSFVPFVSKLRAKADESRIFVSWLNPRDLQGTILLYRHTSEIDRDNLSDAVLVARLSSDQQSYEDTPPEAGSYYYAVLIEGTDGKVQELLIPCRNKTSLGARLSVPPSAEVAAARITGIQAEVVADSVHISFRTSNPGRDLLLFRSDAPITGTEDLMKAFAPLQLEAGTTRVVDYPIPGVESYYAVVDTELFKSGEQVLVSGENTTVGGVVVPLDVPRAALLPETGIRPEAGIKPEAGSKEGSAAEEAGSTEAVPGAQATYGAQAAAGAPVAAGAQSAVGVDVPGQRRAAMPAARTTAPVAEFPVQPRTQTGQQNGTQTGLQSGARTGDLAAAQALAATPLPYLQPAQDSRNIYSIPQTQSELNSETRAAISRILTTAPPLEVAQKKVEILPEDADERAIGESMSLHRILKENLLTGDFATAEAKLQGFLDIRRTPFTEARARFYLAQAYYFQGLYEEALLEFVLSRDQLYAPAESWMDSCFRHLWEQP